jgi:hypothetical protein
MKRLIWGVLIGSVIMALVVAGPPLYLSLLSPPSGEPPSWPGSAIASALLFYGGMIIAGIVAGAITGGSRRKNVLAGALYAIPATVVYWCAMEVAYIGDGFIPPFVLVVTAGLEAIGGLTSYGIQSLKRLAK